MLAQRLLAIKQQATNKTLYQIISDLGLTGNLKLCLDAGDSASYNPAVQTDKWLDTSGNGYDFYRGTGTGSDAADPTFNGTAGGLSSAEYFSFDGADYFTYDSANETWMSNLGSSGAKFSFFTAYYHPSATSGALWATRTNNFTNHGASCFISSSGATPAYASRMTFSNNSGSSLQSPASDSALTVSEWNFIGCSFDNAAATNNLKWTRGSSADPADSFSNTKSTTSTSGAMRIGECVAGGTSVALPSGARLAAFAMWEGVALTSTQLTDIYNAIKGRFGI